ncbi:MAG: hypothetical protein KAS32_28335 [Candidatus Peribacteraceae bacterium]|nr:hypothetical protein [Candidatus Peribacteraceae bacterium]
MAKNKYRDRSGRPELARAVKLHDQLAAFESFKNEILPALRADLKTGLDAAAIYDKYQAYAAARGVTIAMTSADEGKSLQAIKDILDRAQGKAVERRETKHQFEELSDEELDAMVLTELEDNGEVEVKTKRKSTKRTK